MDFEHITDWASYLRDAIDRPAEHPELAQVRPEATTTPAALGALYATLSDTTQIAMADGAVTLVEAGDPKHARSVLTIPLERAPNAARRIGAAVTAHRARLDDTLVDGLVDRALKADANDPTLTAAIDAESGRRGPRMLQLMALYRPDWVAAHLDKVPTSSDADGKELLRVVDRTRTPDLPSVISAIAAAGPDYVARLKAAMAGWPASAQARVAPALQAHPAFATP